MTVLENHDVLALLDVVGEVSIRWAEGFDVGRIVEVSTDSFTVRTRKVDWQYSRHEALDAAYRGTGYIEPLPSTLDDGSSARVGPRLDVGSLPWRLRKWA